MKTKILIVGNYTSSIGGISGQIDILLNNLPKSDCYVNLLNCKKGIFGRLLLPFQLLIRGRNYNVFHVHGCSYLGFIPIIIGVVIGRILQKKVVVTYHGGGLQDYLNKYKHFVLFFLRRADLITVPSKFLFDILKNEKLNIIVLPNVMRIDNVEFVKRNVFHPKFIVTRSLERVYNIELAIKAFAEIKKRHSDATLRIVGEGSLKDDLMQYVIKENIADVIFSGTVSNDHIGDELNKADIYINPTKLDSFSISMFEAFACGLPVVSSAVGAIPDFIKDQENGFLFQSENLEQLVAKIEYILSNQDDISIVVQKAHVLFSDYTWPKLESKYIEIYQSHLSSKK